jgi:hypothetical protein
VGCEKIEKETGSCTRVAAVIHCLERDLNKQGPINKENKKKIDWK